MTGVLIPLSNHGQMLVSAEDAAFALAHAWYQSDRGYVCVEIGGRKTRQRLYFHRCLLNAPANLTVDHINGDPLDNRRENLRLATQAQQNANQRKSRGESAYRGVYPRHDGKAWVAQIKINRRAQRLGSFTDEADAARAYDTAARATFGVFARLNFPLPDEQAATKKATSNRGRSDAG